MWVGGGHNREQTPCPGQPTYCIMKRLGAGFGWLDMSKVCVCGGTL